MMPALFAILVALSAQTTAPVIVSVRETVTTERTSYSYRVNNRSKKPIVALRIGYDAAREKPQLRTLPRKWTFQRGLAAGTSGAPAGWSVRLVTEEENPKFMLEWTSERGRKSDIAPGTSRDGFRITLDKPAREYRQSNFEVALGDGTRQHGRVRLMQ